MSENKSFIRVLRALESSPHPIARGCFTEFAKRAWPEEIGDGKATRWARNAGGTLARLGKRGLAHYGREGWVITQQGRHLLDRLDPARFERLMARIDHLEKRLEELSKENLELRYMAFDLYGRPGLREDGEITTYGDPEINFKHMPVDVIRNLMAIRGNK